MTGGFLDVLNFATIVGLIVLALVKSGKNPINRRSKLNRKEFIRLLNVPFQCFVMPVMAKIVKVRWLSTEKNFLPFFLLLCSEIADKSTLADYTDMDII